MRYSCGSIWCRRQVLVKLARVANVRPPRGLPTKREFFLFNTTRSKPATFAAVRPTRAPIASDESPGARRQKLPWPGSLWRRGDAARPRPHARFPVPFFPHRQPFVSRDSYLDHQIRVIIPTPALSRLGPPKTLQRAKIERGCRDNASNFFWVRLVHTS